MQIFVMTFAVMLIFVLLMALGYLFKGRSLEGSCGGISDLGLDKVCACEEPCDKRKELMRRQVEQEKAEAKARCRQGIDVRLIDDNPG